MAAGINGNYTFVTGMGAVVFDAGVNTLNGGAASQFSMTGSIYITGGAHFNASHGVNGTPSVNASDIYVQNGVLAIMNYDDRLQTNVDIHMSDGGTFSLRQIEGWGDVGGNQTVGVLQGTGGTVTNAAANATYTLTVNQTGGTYTYSGLISGNMNLVKSGAGTWVLTGTANAYTGSTTLAGGQLVMSNTAGSVFGTGNLTLNAGTLASGATGSMSGSVSGGTTASYWISPGGNAGAGVLTIGTSGTTTASLNLTSSATLEFANLTGTTPGVNQDQLVVNGALNFSGTGSITLVLPTSQTTLGTFTLIDAKAPGNITDASAFSVAGGLPTNDTLTWDNVNYDLLLTVANPTYWTGGVGGLWSNSSSWGGQSPLNGTGVTAVFNGGGSSPAVVDVATTIGSLQYSSSTSYEIRGPATLTFNNGTVNSLISLASGTASQLISANVLLASNLEVSNASSNSLTISGNISETGSHSLTLDTGLLVLSGGANSYTGATNILSGGTLRMGAVNAAAPTSIVTLVAGATLDLASNSQVIGGLSGPGGSVTSAGAAALTINQIGNTSFGGLISGGSLSVIKSGSGTLTLSGATPTAAGRPSPTAL